MVEDYKRLINYDKNELSLAPVHSLETLYKNIENAPLVIWDKFMMIDSAYDKDKIYDILCIRHRKGLANFYFSINGTSYTVEKGIIWRNGESYLPALLEIFISDDNKVWINNEILYYADGTPVSPDDEIRDGENYTTKSQV